MRADAHQIERYTRRGDQEGLDSLTEDFVIDANNGNFLDPWDLSDDTLDIGGVDAMSTCFDDVAAPTHEV